jgi:hypothetical protein
MQYLFGKVRLLILNNPPLLKTFPFPNNRKAGSPCNSVFSKNKLPVKGRAFPYLIDIMLPVSN